MSAPAESSGKAGAVKAKDPYVEMAEKIYIQLASRVFGTLSGSDQKKPDPKALGELLQAVQSFRLQATRPVEEAAD